MKILVVGTPKRNFSIGFDPFVLGLSRAGIDFDHYPNILTESFNFTGTYPLQFDTADIAYPEYSTIVSNLKKKHYDLIITTVCRVDYECGRYGKISRVSRRFKYLFEGNKYKMGGTLVMDWLRSGMELPPIAVIDDMDDPFIWPRDFELFMNCAVYFKREMPFDEFFCYRLFDIKFIDKQKRIDLTQKLKPIWISYDKESIDAFTDTDTFIPYEERDIDVAFFCNIHMSHNRVKILPILEALGKKYNVITTENSKFAKDEFYEKLKRCKIGISLDGRGWDCPKHYELMLCGTLLFIPRPPIQLAIDLKDGENCIFIDNQLRDVESLVHTYLNDIELCAGIAKKGHELTKRSLGNDKLVEYVLEITKQVIGKNNGI